MRAYPGVTMLNAARGRAAGSATGRPATWKDRPNIVPSTGMPVEMDAEATPGTASTRSSSWR